MVTFEIENKRLESPDNPLFIKISMGRLRDPIFNVIKINPHLRQIQTNVGPILNLIFRRVTLGTTLRDLTNVRTHTLVGTTRTEHTCTVP